MNRTDLLLIVEPALTVLVLGGTLVVKLTKLTEAIKNVGKSLGKIVESVESHEHRLTVIETKLGSK